MKYSLLFILFLFTLSVFAQKNNEHIKINGIINDADSQRALPYATITLQNLVNANFSGGISDESGRFDFYVNPGQYKLTVEFLSFEPFIVEKFDLTQDTDMGIIELIQDAENLDEVEIKTNSELVDYSFNKKVYNASKDIANISGNAISVLENTPSVSINDQGGISVRGNKAMVLVNGKPFAGQDGNIDVLSLIPSNTISKVEIISRSAKYDAQGGGGIINIILKKGKGLGYNGTIEVHGGIPDNDGVSTFLNFKSDRINVFSTASFNHLNRIKNSETKQYYFNSNDFPTGNFDETREDNRQKNSLLFNIGSDFNIDSKNKLTFSVLYSMANKNFDSDLFLNDFNNGDELIQSNSRKVDDNSDENFFETYINYATLFKKEGHKLSFDLRFESSKSDNITHIFNQKIEPKTLYSEQETSILQKLDSYFFKTDYELPLFKTGLLELGFKTNYRNYSNLFESEEPLSLPSIATVPLITNDLNYDEAIYSFYTNFGNEYKNFSYSFGLRTETTYVEINESVFDLIMEDDYTDFFPSVNLGYSINNKSQLSFNYTRYIDRPSVSQLNPFISFTDPRLILSGNPYLKPYYTNYFLLEYYKGFDKLSINSLFFYSGSTDQISNVINKTGRVTGDGFNIYELKPVNNGDLNQYGFEFSMNYRPTEFIRLRAMFTPYYFDLENTIDNAYDYSDYVYVANAVADLRFPLDLNFQVYFMYQSDKKTALTKLDATHYTNMSLAKDFLNGKATLSFSVSDVFNTREYVYESFEANTTTEKNWMFESQYLLSFTYRFNKAKRRNSNNRTKDTENSIFEFEEEFK